MKKRNLFLLIAVLAISSNTAANEMPVIGESGSVRLLNETEHTQVQMVREWVRMDVYPEYYIVKAQFVFKNHGGETAVRMCFPERNYDPAKRSGFKWFRAYIDGTQVPAKRVKVDPVNDWYGEDACWVKRVGFAEKGRRIVRVEYTSPATKTSYGDRYVFYDFTGGGWAGKVEESEFRAYLHIPGSYIMMGGEPSVRKGKMFSARWTNWEADTSWQLSYFPVPDGAFITEYDEWYEEIDGAYILKMPGRPNRFIAAPTWNIGVKKKGVLFSSLYDLYHWDYSSRSEDDKRVPDMLYDKHTRVATLSIFGRKFQFKAGSREMVVDGARKVKLEAAPILVPVYSMNENGSIERKPGWSMFVPLVPVIQVLGGKIELDEKTSKVLVKH